jgi:hypothetical protein
VIADVDVIISRGKIKAGTGAKRDVAVTDGIGGQRLVTHSRIVGAGREVQERSVPNRGITIATVSNRA